MPWKIIKNLGAEKVISIVFEPTMKKECCTNIVGVVTNSIGILCHELANYEEIGSDYLLKIRTPDMSLLDIKQIDNLYNLGYKQTKQKIQEIKKIINI